MKKIIFKGIDYKKVRRFKKEKDAERFAMLLEEKNADKSKRFPAYVETVTDYIGSYKLRKYDVYVPMSWGE